MRLVCPNCSAQYEIDASMIPDEGRDVQCSNCGHTWFELPAPPELAAEPVAATDPVSEPEPTEESEPVAEAEPAPEIEAASEPEVESAPEPETAETGAAADTGFEEPETDTESDDLSEDVAALDSAFQPTRMVEQETPTTRELEDEEEAVFGAAAKPARRPPASDDALDILREEADREIEQRRAPPSVPLETQTDMALDTLASQRTPSRALRARMARMDEDDQEQRPARGRWRNRFGKGKAEQSPERDTVESQPDDGYREPRRDLLPDIEEINSTLTSTTARDLPEPEVLAEQQKGFRQGFVIPVAVAALMIVLYAYAPSIAQSVPATEPALLQYVDLANGARDGLGQLIGR